MDYLIDKSLKTSLKKNQIFAEKGRLPWFDVDGKPAPAYIIGITGGSASGKSSVARRVIEELGVPWVLVVGQDSFYKSLSPEQSKRAFRNEYDFDNPEAFDYAALRECIANLRESRAVQIPVYSFTEHQRMPETQYLYGASVIIVEGILVLHDPQLRELLDLKVFVQCDSDIMLARRIRRDIQDRGRQIEGVLEQYLKFVKPSFDNHILPTSRHADIIVPGFSNQVAINIIVTHIRKQLDERNLALRNHLKEEPRRSLPTTPKPGSKIISYAETHQDCETFNLTVLKQTDELVALHTSLRSRITQKGEFGDSAKRLADLLIARALEMLDLSKQNEKSICAVTIAGVGSRLQDALERALSDVPVGTLTIESHEDSAEPVLCETNLPMQLRAGQESASQARVLLLDSQVGTGAAAIMALRVLLDHGVREESIVLVCFICSRRGGCRALASAFPRVRILSSCVDEGVEHLATDGHTAFVQGQADDRHPWNTFSI